LQSLTLRANTRAGRGPGAWRHVAGVAATLAAAAGTAVFAWLGMRWLGHELLAGNETFCLRPADIRVEIRGSTLTREHVLQYTELGSYSNLFAMDLDRVRRDFLREVPLARDISFSRQLPGTLLVEVTERLPLARIERSPGAYLAVDREGVVLTASAAGTAAPAITGHGIRPLTPGLSLATNRAMRAVTLLDLCETAEWSERIRVAAVDVGRADRLEVTLAGGERIALAWSGMAESGELSRRNLEIKLNKMAEILRAAAARGKRVESADLTLDRNIPVLYR
jgi:cell division septal protein FtsQ